MFRGARLRLCCPSLVRGALHWPVAARMHRDGVYDRHIPMAEEATDNVISLKPLPMTPL